jgi:hypothetical protein
MSPGPARGDFTMRSAGLRLNPLLLILFVYFCIYLSYIALHFYFFHYVDVFLYLVTALVRIVPSPKRRKTVGRTSLDELITRPEESYRLWLRRCV